MSDPLVSLAEQPLSALPRTFLDVETTGLSAAQGHRVCELAVLRVHGTAVETLHSLIQPQRPSDPGAFAAHGLTPEMLADAPLFGSKIDALLPLLRDSVLIAHNAPFDLAFLEHEFRYAGRELPPRPVIDTLRLAQRIFSFRSYSLSALAQQLDLRTQPDHRAMQDVLTLRELFQQLVQRLAAGADTPLDTVLRLQRGFAPDQPEPDTPPVLATALREQRRLRITYRARSSARPTVRDIQPYELLYAGRTLCVRAFCYLRNDQRTFAIARITAMELVEADQAGGSVK